jgi:hypothetical protein
LATAAQLVVLKAPTADEGKLSNRYHRLLLSEKARQQRAATAAMATYEEHRNSCWIPLTFAHYASEDYSRLAQVVEK